MVQLSKAVRAGLDAFPLYHWQMLSVTFRHHAGLGLRWLRDCLMRGWRKCRQIGTVQRIFKRRVVGSVRAFEVTHSLEHGWHPHLHLCLLTTDWADEERDTLRDAFLRCFAAEVCATEGTRYTVRTKKGELREKRGEAWSVERARTYGMHRGIGRDYFTTHVEHSMRWSEKRLTLRDVNDGDTKLEAYITDVGLELSLGPTKTTHANMSRTPWQIAEAACDGDRRSVSLWREYESATKGTRCIELDDRAAHFADVLMHDDVEAAGECTESALTFDGAKSVGEESVYVELHPEMLWIVRDFERYVDPLATLRWLEAAASTPGPLTAVDVERAVDTCIQGMVRSLSASSSYLASRAPNLARARSVDFVGGLRSERQLEELGGASAGA